MRLIASLLHLALLLGAAPGFSGLVAAAAAWRAGLPLPSPLSAYRAWRALWRQEQVFLDATAHADAAIACGLAAAVLAAALTPSFTTALATQSFALLPLVAGLLVMAELMPLLARLSSGDMAQGIAAGRIIGFFCLASPALFLILWVLAQLDGGMAVGGMALGGIAVPHGAGGARVPRLLVLLTLAALVRAAPAAAPLPETSGRVRVMALWAAALGRLAALSLIAALCFPLGLAGMGHGLAGWGLGLFAWAVKMLIGAVLLAALRPARPPASRLITPALLIATLAAMFAALLAGMGPI